MGDTDESPVAQNTHDSLHSSPGRTQRQRHQLNEDNPNLLGDLWSISNSERQDTQFHNKMEDLSSSWDAGEEREEVVDDMYSERESEQDYTPFYQEFYWPRQRYLDTPSAQHLTNSLGEMRGEKPHLYPRVPNYCYRLLRLENCSDPRITDNFWFYNLCEDECMLYAADICDNNINRFTSLEKCEVTCRQPIGQLGSMFLSRKQEKNCSPSIRKVDRERNKKKRIF